MENINFDDFKKIQIAVGKILLCEKVEGSEKLLKLEVDFRENFGRRQIVSGIAKTYSPEFLIGKLAIFCVNLEPRKIMGLESQGMIMCADSEEGPVILQPEKDVIPGSIIK